MGWGLFLFALATAQARQPYLRNTDPTLEPESGMQAPMPELIGPDGNCMNHHVRCGCPATPPCRRPPPSPGDSGGYDLPTAGSGRGAGSQFGFESTIRSRSRSPAKRGPASASPVEVTLATDATVSFVSFGAQKPEPAPSPSAVPPPPVEPLAPQTAVFQAAPLK